MISTRFRMILLVAVVIYFVSMFHYLKKGRLMVKYTLLWIFVGVLLAFLLIFPGSLSIISQFMGIYSDTNMLTLIALGGTMIILISLTAIVSVQTLRIKRLTQHLSILDHQLREIKDNLDAKGDSEQDESYNS